MIFALKLSWIRKYIEIIIVSFSVLMIVNKQLQQQQNRLRVINNGTSFQMNPISPVWLRKVSWNQGRPKNLKLNWLWIIEKVVKIWFWTNKYQNRPENLSNEQKLGVFNRKCMSGRMHLESNRKFSTLSHSKSRWCLGIMSYVNKQQHKKRIIFSAFQISQSKNIRCSISPHRSRCYNFKNESYICAREIERARARKRRDWKHT